MKWPQFKFICLLVLVMPALVIAESYRIGAVVPLTGELARVGGDIRDGITLALEERGAGGMPIEVNYEDNQYDSKMTATAARKVLDRDRVDLVISLWDTSEVVAPMAERKGVLHISIRWNPNVASRHANTFTIESTYKSWVDSQVELLRQLGKRRVSIMWAESEGWNLSAARMIELLPEKGIDVVDSQSFAAPQTDFRSMLTRAISKNPDHLILFTLNPETELVLRQKDALNWKVSHSGFYEAQENLAQIEGQPFVAQQAVSEEFKQKFEKRFNRPFHSRAPHAYEIIKIVSSALGADQVKPAVETMTRRISAMNNIPSSLGLLKVSATRNIENQPIWMVVREGRYVTYPTSAQ